MESNYRKRRIHCVKVAMTHQKVYRTVTILAALAITIVLVFFLLSQIRICDFIIILSKINLLYLFLAFIPYVCAYFLRALRFYILLNREISVKDLFSIVCLHTFMNNILPARTGELTYIYLLKLRNKRISEGIATLAFARFFDFISISLLFIISSFFVGLFKEFMMLICVTFLIITSISCFTFMSKKFMKKRILNYLPRKIDEIIDNFMHVRKSGKLKQLMAVSILVWISLYSAVYFIVISINLNLTFFEVLFASSFAIITTILPIQGIGGFGTTEGGWCIGFIAIGLTKDAAISTGFAFHIIILAYSAILGFYSFSQIIMFKKQIFGYEKK